MNNTTNFSATFLDSEVCILIIELVHYCNACLRAQVLFWANLGNIYDSPYVWWIFSDY